MLSIIFLTSVLFFLLGKNKISFGIVIGGLAGIINFRLMVKDAKRKLDLAVSRGRMFFPLGYLARYAIMAAVLLIMSLKGLSFLIGGAIGLFCLRLSIFADTLLLKERIKNS
ncbi:MAG: ATP synthase subunit I [Candidatus Omnitrophota bacterium]|nr:ATP synthase subunit I [Candidatus Omnitrophota bacterium]